MLEGDLSQISQQKPKYSHHVVDVQHLILNIVMQMRKRPNSEAVMETLLESNQKQNEHDHKNWKSTHKHSKFLYRGFGGTGEMCGK